MGIGFKIASVMAFVLMSVLLKLAPEVPVGQMVFFRSFFAIIPVLGFLALRGEFLEGFRTARPMGHILRGFVGVTGMTLVFFALTRLPLPEATTINYATPLVITIAGAVFLGERVRAYRWSAIIVGLVGVLIIMWPRLTVFTSGEGGDLDHTLGALAAFGACFTSAIAFLTIRNLLRTEKSATIVVWFSLTCAALSLVTLPFGWVMPDPLVLTLLVGSGILGGLGQVWLTEAYRHTDVSVVAPFEYTSMLASIALGYLVFADIPTPQMLVGGAVVVASGIFLVWRERRLGLRRAALDKLTTPES